MAEISCREGCALIRRSGHSLACGRAIARERRWRGEAQLLRCFSQLGDSGACGRMCATVLISWLNGWQRLKSENQTYT